MINKLTPADLILILGAMMGVSFIVGLWFCLFRMDEDDWGYDDDDNDDDDDAWEVIE